MTSDSDSVACTYQSCFNETWSLDSPPAGVRFVALDTETTGPDPRRDRLISIGAVGIVAGQIHLSDTFEELLYVGYNGPSVKVHGITRDEARDGAPEPEALARFLEYLRDGVIVGHHIGHDVRVIGAACERHFGIPLLNRHTDTMDVALRLADAGGFPGVEEFGDFSLDSLCELFKVTPHDRHTAGGDAFITAQIFLKLLRIADGCGFRTLGSLVEPLAPPI
jgi:DNA polymerase III subunit epsilon